MVDVRQESRNSTAILVDQHIAATQGGRRALHYGSKSYSYHDVAALMNRAGNMLRDIGVGRGQAVLLIMRPSPAFVAAVLGAMKIGAVPVILNDEVTGKTIAAAVAKVAPPAIIIDQQHAAELESLDSTKGPAPAMIMVGESINGHRSFVDLLRESPSSLVGARVDDGEPALTILSRDGATTFTHSQLADPGGLKGSLRLAMPGLDLGTTLCSFAECGEATIAAETR